jgi:putative pyruvate formate lyase activating enzyme
VDRLAGERGVCGVGRRARVASFGPHFGEERPLVGRRGSGAVFFAGCNLTCAYCQNWTISQGREGTDLDPHALADLFCELQQAGCHNLNLVTPTHQAYAIVVALATAAEAGFDLPVVWNSGGYDGAEAVSLLDGVVDIYMPDLKYGEDAVASRLSGVPDYVARSRDAIREMHRQVGDLDIGADGIARRGLLVRHLVLPGGLSGTESVMRFLAEEISPDTYVNVMDQYHPCYQAGQIPEIARSITAGEFAEAMDRARAVGLHCFA